MSSHNKKFYATINPTWLCPATKQTTIKLKKIKKIKTNYKESFTIYIDTLLPAGQQTQRDQKKNQY
jgi:hypothetical protein